MPAIIKSLQASRVSKVSKPSEVKVSSGKGASEIVTRERVGWKENQRVENSVLGTGDRVNEWRGAMEAQRAFVTSLHRQRTFVNEVRIAMGFKPKPPPLVESANGFLHFPNAGEMGEEQTQLAAARASMQAVGTATARKMSLLLQTRITEKEKLRVEKPRRWRTHQKRQ